MMHTLWDTDEATPVSESLSALPLTFWDERAKALAALNTAMGKYQTALRTAVQQRPMPARDDPVRDEWMRWLSLLVADLAAWYQLKALSDALTARMRAADTFGR